MIKIAVTLTFFYTCTTLLFAQSPLFEFKGKLVDAKTGEPVMYANMINNNRNTGCISDTNGIFEINAMAGDSLVFYTMGYLGKVVVVKQQIEDEIQKIEVESRQFEINEVKVIAFRSYEDFKKKLLDTDVPKTDIELLNDKIRDIAYTEAMDAYNDMKTREILEGGSFGVGGAVPILSKDEKSYMKLREINKVEAKRRYIDTKFNRDLVTELTHLEGEELTDFIIFCNFNEDFLYTASKELIISQILLKFDEYSKQLDCEYRIVEEILLA
ncbi:MAG: carboxypeptidase-like regulatory domain-containing protein [Bacteroidales bacterium]|nr:carboxypeptidase-like regulatory domain-containing protein [Bacteroidales bacterium]